MIIIVILNVVVVDNNNRQQQAATAERREGFSGAKLITSQKLRMQTQTLQFDVDDDCCCCRLLLLTGTKIDALL